MVEDAAHIVYLARGQAQKVDRVFTDATDRLRGQLVRADRILTGTLEAVEEAGSQFKHSFWRRFAKLPRWCRESKLVLICCARVADRRKAMSRSNRRKNFLYNFFCFSKDVNSLALRISSAFCQQSSRRPGRCRRRKKLRLGRASWRAGEISNVMRAEFSRPLRRLRRRVRACGGFLLLRFARRTGSGDRNPVCFSDFK